eukprot:416354-Heterocapsa_arctica.AAC.1
MRCRECRDDLPRLEGGLARVRGEADGTFVKADLRAQELGDVDDLWQHPAGRVPWPFKRRVHDVAVVPGAQGLLQDVDQDA